MLSFLSDNKSKGFIKPTWLSKNMAKVYLYNGEKKRLRGKKLDGALSVIRRKAYAVPNVTKTFLDKLF